MEKTINIFLFKAEGNNENFGEYLCKKVIYELGFKLNNYSNIRRLDRPIDYIMTGIGGFLNNNIYMDFFGDKIKKWYVWGSGVECTPVPGQELPMSVLKDKCIITMLRGPMTKSFYGIEGDILLGDPGYLASYFFKFPIEEKKNVFIQFYYDKVAKKIDGADVHLSSLLPAPIDNSFFNVLKNISNAKIVLTGSMHIAVAAHSYGVPWALVSKEHTDLANEWKWHDTLSNIGIDKEDIKLCNSVEEGFEWWNSIKTKVKPITKEYQEKIIGAFPCQ